MRADDVAGGALRDRVKSGASLADVEPMAIDKSVSPCVNQPSPLSNLPLPLRKCRNKVRLKTGHLHFVPRRAFFLLKY